MKQYLIPHEGRFFKANLHAHSTFSDGRLTPAQMKGLYQTGGYSVIAFTDHNVLQWHKDLDAPDFLALCGYEVDVCETAPDGYSRCCHLCAISRDPEHAVLIPRLLVQGGMDQGEAVSAYGVTFGMTLPMLLLPTAFLSALGLVLTPKLSQYSALGQKEAIRRQVKRSVGAANLILIPALALLAVLGSAIGQSLYRDDRVGDHLPLLALGVLFSCWQTLSACVLSGVNRQGASAGIALAADSVQLVLTCLTVGRHGGVCLQLCPVSPAGSGAQLAGGFPGNWAFPAGVFLVYRPHPGRLPGGLLRGFDGDGAASGRPGLLSRRGGGTVLWTAALFGGPAGHGGREQRGRTAAISFTGSIKGQQPFLSKRGCCFLLLGKSAGSISCRESLLLARLHTFHFSLV